MYLADTLFFLLFSSGKEQEWNKLTTSHHTKIAPKNADGMVVSVLSEEKSSTNKVMQNGNNSVGSTAYSRYVSEGNRNWHHNKAYHPD